MTSACTSQPVSWLRLERFALGELPEADQHAVSAHLEECDACRACMAHLRDREPAELPALPDAVLSAPIPWWRPHRLRLAWGGGFVAVAAAAALALVLSSRGARVEDETGFPGRRTEVKGGEVVLDLVRERAGSVAYEPDGFLPEDRFELLLSCPPAAPLHVDVVVYQDGEASFPLPPTALECGNRVVLPGAFRLTGRGPATVCVLFDAVAPPARTSVAMAEPDVLEDAVCATLRPGSTAP